MDTKEYTLPVMTSLATRVQPGPKVLFRDLGGEAVLLEMESGKYFGFNEVGTRIWQLLREYGRVEPVYQALLGEYDVASERLHGDLLAFVQRLAARGLVELHEA